MSGKSDTRRIHEDAKPQFVRGRKGAGNSGVSSAEPRVITGDEDATFTTHPGRHTPHPKTDSQKPGSGG